MKNYNNYIFENKTLGEKLINPEDEQVMKKLLGNSLFYNFEFKKVIDTNFIQIRIKENELNFAFDIDNGYLDVRDYVDYYQDCLNGAKYEYEMLDGHKHGMNDKNLKLYDDINNLFHSETFIKNLTSFTTKITDSANFPYLFGLELEIVIERNFEKQLQKNAKAIAKKLSFDISVDDEENDYILILFNLHTLEDKKSLYDIFYNQIDILQEMKTLKTVNLDEEEYKKFNSQLNEILEKAYTYFKENREKILMGFDVVDKTLLMHLIGGDFYDTVISHDYQEKYINDNVDNYKKLLSIEGSGTKGKQFKINDKIRKKYSYLEDLDKFDI